LSNRPGAPRSADTERSRASRNPLARLDRIPVWPYERKLLWILGAGYFFAFFDIVTIAFALPVIAQQFHVSKTVVAYSVTSSLIGYIIGAYANSTIADKWGRKLGLRISVGLFSVGTLVAAFSPNVTVLIIFRFVAGMGIGAEIAAVTTYIGELSPAPLRGRYTSWATTAAFAGLGAVPLVARALVPSFASGWRVLFIIGALGSLTILYMRRGLPPSPRWLASQGREAEASQVVAESEELARDMVGGELPKVEPVAAEPEPAAAEAAAAEAESAPESAPAEAESEPATNGEVAGDGGGDDAEGARLIALNMALNGTPREETARYLSENFSLSDANGLLDEVYASVDG